MLVKCWLIMNNVILRSQITLQLSLGVTIKCKALLSRT